MEGRISKIQKQLEDVDIELKENREQMKRVGLSDDDKSILNKIYLALLEKEKSLRELETNDHLTSSTPVPAPPGNSITLPQLLPRFLPSPLSSSSSASSEFAFVDQITIKL